MLLMESIPFLFRCIPGIQSLHFTPLIHLIHFMQLVDLMPLSYLPHLPHLTPVIGLIQSISLIQLLNSIHLLHSIPWISTAHVSSQWEWSYALAHRKQQYWFPSLLCVSGFQKSALNPKDCYGVSQACLLNIRRNLTHVGQQCFTMSMRRLSEGSQGTQEAFSEFSGGPQDTAGKLSGTFYEALRKLSRDFRKILRRLSGGSQETPRKLSGNS